MTREHLSRVVNSAELFPGPSLICTASNRTEIKPTLDLPTWESLSRNQNFLLEGDLFAKWQGLASPFTMGTHSVLWMWRTPCLGSCKQNRLLKTQVITSSVVGISVLIHVCSSLPASVLETGVFHEPPNNQGLSLPSATSRDHAVITISSVFLMILFVLTWVLRVPPFTVPQGPALAWEALRTKVSPHEQSRAQTHMKSTRGTEGRVGGLKK